MYKGIKFKNDDTTSNDEDLDTVGQINFQSMVTTYRAIVPDIEQQISPESRTSRLRNWFNSTGAPRVIFIADEGQEAIGYVACSYKKFQNYLAELRSFHVLPFHQNKGIGSQLFDRTVNWLIQSHINSLYVEALEANPFHHFYEKKGGQIISTSMQKTYGLDLKVVAYGWPELHRRQSTSPIK